MEGKTSAAAAQREEEERRQAERLEQRARDEGYPFVVHGSADSVDVDVVYFFPAPLPSFRQCQLFCSGKPPHNRNIYVCQNGYVTVCFKGLPDEGNNSILRTYGLHPQSHPLPIVGEVKRIVPLKTVRAVRSLLTRLTRTKYRQQVKTALRSTNFAARVACLAGLDFASVEYENLIEDAKSIASQMGQTLALIEGVELFTKSEVAQQYPDLEPFMKRDASVPSLLPTLNAFRDRLVSPLCRVKVVEKGPLNLITAWADKASEYDGMIIDMKAERCITFPPPAAAAGDASSTTESSSTWAAASYVHGGKLHLATPQTLELEEGRQIDMSRCAKLDLASSDGERTIAIDIERLHEQFFPLWRVALDDPGEAITKEQDKTEHYLVALRLIGLRRKDNNQAVPPADWQLYVPSAV